MTTNELGDRRRIGQRAAPGLVALAAALALAVSVSTAAAAPPVDQGRDHFVTAPFASSICGVDGTEVDTVVTSFIAFASGAAVNPINVLFVFTATGSGKTIEWRQAGAALFAAPVDNGDGTFTQDITTNGTSAVFKLPKGPVLVTDVGTITVALTFDSQGNFISFAVVRIAGQRPAGCDAIIAALT